VREAADFAIRFKMQSHFTLDEMVLPLIKRKLVDSFIRYVEVMSVLASLHCIANCDDALSAHWYKYNM
jgi:hypothetical protein